MKTTLFSKVLRPCITCLFFISSTLFSGCDLLSTEDDEEPVCEGDVVLIHRLHNSTTTPEKVSDPYRECYSYGLIEQRNLYMNMGTVLDVSNIYIELNGPALGTEGAHHYYHTITLTSAGKDFFEAEPAGITASFSTLDANKLPRPGDKYITGFEMLKIDPATRQISFAITESEFRTGNYTTFIFEPYEFINLVVPENP